MNKDKLSQIQGVLNEVVNSDFAAGLSCLVIKDGIEQCYYDAGYRDIEKKLPMTRDTICRMFSMSKIVTSVAIMMLVEQGKLDLFDNVSKYLPGYKNPKVYNLDGSFSDAYREIRIQDLLNMTSGIPYPGNSSPGERAAAALIDELSSRLNTNNPMTTFELANRYGKNPLNFNPGTDWLYGFSADVLGAIVEIVSDQKFSTFLKEKIFDPLGMKDTDFFVPESKQNRLANAYEETPDGLKLFNSSHLGILIGEPVPPAFESGGAGLCSVIDDFAALAQMLMNGGSYNGIELLSPETVKFMTSAHLSPLQQLGFNKLEHQSGYSYGNLLRVMTDPGRSLTISETGEYGWDGWLGCYLANDPANQLSILMMCQKTDAGTTRFTRLLRNVIYSAL